MRSHSSRLRPIGFAVIVGSVLVVPACGDGGSSGGLAQGGNTAMAGTGGVDTGGSTAGSGAAGAATGGTVAGGMATGGMAAGGAGTSGGGTVGSGVAGMGTSGSGTGGIPQTAAACKGIVPTGALISNFDDLVSPVWGEGTSDSDFSGGFYTYPGGPIALSMDADNLSASGNIATYAGFGLYVTYCGDASSYAGVKFKISGNAGQSGRLVFYVQTNANKWADGQKGACLGPKAVEFTDCIPPSTLIEGITAEPKEVTILWSDVQGGKPAAAATTDGSDIIGFNWMFNWPEAAAYAASITIDDFEFVSEGAGAGGAGAGGASGAGGAP